MRFHKNIEPCHIHHCSQPMHIDPQEVFQLRLPLPHDLATKHLHHGTLSCKLRSGKPRLRYSLRRHRRCSRCCLPRLKTLCQHHAPRKVFQRRFPLLFKFSHKAIIRPARKGPYRSAQLSETVSSDIDVPAAVYRDGITVVITITYTTATRRYSSSSPGSITTGYGI